MSKVIQQIREIDSVDAAQAIEQVALETEPVVFRGLVSEWPLVGKSRAKLNKRLNR